MNGRRLACGAIGLAVWACATAASAATPFFLLDAQGGPSFLYRLNPSTGQITNIGALPLLPYGQAGGLAATGPNHLYVTTDSGWVLSVTVDPFAFTALGTLGVPMPGAAYSFDGTLYAVDEGQDELLRIDVTPTLARTVIGKVRVGSPSGPLLDVSGADLVQAAGGGWLLWTNSTQDLYALDVTTAVVTQLDPASAPLGTRSGLAVDYQGGGTLYASSAPLDALLTVAPTTGITLAAVNFCFSCPTVFNHGSGDLASPPCVDADGDGFAVDGGLCGPADCNDASPTAYPGASERCNGQDDDCDAVTDEDPEASAACQTACTQTAQCVAGACVTTPTVCDDTNPCTSDRCDPVDGCRFDPQPDGLSCSDGDVCSGAEVCLGGTCVDAPDLDCNDGNGCTADSCAPLNGCRNTPVPGCCTIDADCADASACTVHERCVAGQCLSDPVGCDDGNVCTSDSCNPASGCVNIAVVNGVACGDGDVCDGLETCQSGTCTPGSGLDCDDGNTCTVDGCNSLSGCTRVQVPACCTIDADCADSSACTINERCVANSCVSDPLTCDDGNACTSDGCNPASGCTFTAVPNGQSCSDIDVCNGIETCQSGTCTAMAGPNCDDGNPCTDDGCDGLVGCTHAAVPGCCFTNADCVDSDACTVGERCEAGACVSDARNCLDTNPCTTDTCLPAIGCVHTPLIDGTSCSDGAACDGLETCAAATCTTGTPPNCDDANGCTADACDNGTGCTHDAIDDCCNLDADCADTDACTVAERCAATHTCTSDARICTDGNVCTLDGCDPEAGCQFPPAPGGACDDGMPCTTGDTCSAGTCSGAPVACDDGDFCNGEEACLEASGTCSIPSGPPLCTPGSRQSTRTCLAEVYVRNPGNRLGVLSQTQECHQGDAACDADASPLTCTFQLAVCFLVDDPRLAGACTPTNVVLYTLTRPRAASQPAETAAILDAVSALPGALLGGTRGRDIGFAPFLSEARCTQLVSLAVPVGRTLSYRAKTSSATGQRDGDSLRLRCLP